MTKSSSALQRKWKGYRALYTLVEAGRQVISSMRATPPSGKYESAFATALGEMEDHLERIEDICETWSMACDPSLVADIRNALLGVRTKDPKDIPDWRVALASITS